MASFGISDLDIGTDETFDFVCTMCKKKNRNTEADKFCADCQDYYCNTCVKLHDAVPVLQAHKILDKTQFKPGTSASFPVVPTERCKDHGHMPVNMYCKEHDVVGCSTCMVVKHSECRKYYVPEYVSKTKRPDTIAVKVKLDEILISMKDLREEFMNEKKRLTDNRNTVLEMIQDFREEINQRLDELEQNTIQQAEQKLQALIGEIEANLRDIQVITSEVETTLDCLQTWGENLPDLFVRSKIAHEVTLRAERIIFLLTSRKSITIDLTFQENKKLPSFLYELQALGILNTRDATERSSESEIASISSNNESKEFPREPNPVPDLSPSIHNLEKRNISVRVKSDKETCSITSACVLDDGTIILVDYENSNLKRLDRPKYNVRDTCNLPGYLRQVCVTGQQEVAVACGTSQKIQFVAVGQSMTKARQISTNFPCSGLAYADGKLYVSDYFKSVYVYTVSGDRLQQFDKDQYGSELFSAIASLAVNSDSSRIFVADCHKGLLILDMSGKLVGQFGGTELRGARGVSLYKNGNILVSGYDSQNVLQFSTEGKLIGEVMKTDGYCQSVCCDTNLQKLLIGFHKDEIEFYDLR